MDAMAASVCEEVKRLGTVEAITTQVLHAQQKERTDYVLSQNKPMQTARDYLNDTAKWAPFQTIQTMCTAQFS